MILRGGTLFLSQQDVADIVGRLTPQRLMSEMIERLDRAFVKFDSAKVNSTKPRNGYHYKDPVEGSIEWMSILQNEGRYLMKLSGHHPLNPQDYGLPTILGTLLLVDSNTGQLDAVVDASYLTALRTGAASAVASKYMARTNSSTLGIIGCGVQGVTQVQAMCSVFDIREIYFSDSDPETAASFTSRVAAFAKAGTKISSVSTEEAVSRADILCTATSTAIKQAPLFEKAIRTKPFIHINAVGADRKGKAEIPVQFLRRCYVSPDRLNQAVKTGECQNLKAIEIGSELTTIARHGNEYEYLKNKRTVFDSTGWVLEDLIAVELLLEYASLFDIGSIIPGSDSSKSPKDPHALIKPTRSLPKFA